jgi:hypothetical protein
LGLSAILLFASAMKLYSLTDPSRLLDRDGLLGSAMVVGAIATVEAALGLWLVIDGNSPLCRGAASAAFSVFFVVALGKALAGEAECGCFGPLRVSPWWTSLLDAAAVLSLLATGRSVGVFRRGLSFAQVRRGIAKFAICLGVATVLAVATSFVVRAEATDHAGIHEYDDMTIVDPGEWSNGTRLPLLSEIDVGEQLARGQWTVLLVHYDCPTCLAVLDRLRDGQMSTARKVAILEVPPLGPIPPMEACLMGRLSPDRDWFVPTPTRIELNDGLVISVKREME